MITGKMDKLLCERTWPLLFDQFANNNLELANNSP